MRKPSPAFLVASLVLAAAALPAGAQTAPRTGGPLTAVPAGTSATNSSTATTGSANATAGGCRGTGGSSCTATTTNQVGTTGINVVPAPSAPSTTTSPDTVSAPVASPSVGANAGAGAGATSTNNATGPASFGSSARLDASGQPLRDSRQSADATPTGAALGRSPGQTSAGTASGNSGLGLGVGSDSLGTDGTGANVGNTTSAGIGTPATGTGLTTTLGVGGMVLPGGDDVTSASIGGVGSAQPGNGGGTSAAATARAPLTMSSTPLFDQAARSAAARESARRAQGRTPRIIGIAPNTDNDRTHEMPDDPIIRY
jgi:hypothetical protein